MSVAWLGWSTGKIDWILKDLFFFRLLCLYLALLVFVDTVCLAGVKLSSFMTIRKIERSFLLNQLDNKMLLRFENIVSKNCLCG